MLTKINDLLFFAIGHSLSYSSPNEAHLKNQRVALVKKEKNVKLQNQN